MTEIRFGSCKEALLLRGISDNLKWLLEISKIGWSCRHLLHGDLKWLLKSTRIRILGNLLFQRGGFNRTKSLVTLQETRPRWHQIGISTRSISSSLNMLTRATSTRALQSSKIPPAAFAWMKYGGPRMVQHLAKRLCWPKWRGVGTCFTVTASVHGFNHRRTYLTKIPDAQCATSALKRVDHF